MKHKHGVPVLGAAGVAVILGGLIASGTAFAADTMSTGNRGVEGGVGYSSGNSGGDNVGKGPMSDMSAGSIGDAPRETSPNPHATVSPESTAGLAGAPFTAADADRDATVTQEEFDEFRRLYDNLGNEGQSSKEWPAFAEMDRNQDGRLSKEEAQSVFQ